MDLILYWLSYQLYFSCASIDNKLEWFIRYQDNTSYFEMYWSFGWSPLDFTVCQHILIEDEVSLLPSSKYIHIFKEITFHYYYNIIRHPTLPTTTILNPIAIHCSTGGNSYQQMPDAALRSIYSYSCIITYGHEVDRTYSRFVECHYSIQFKIQESRNNVVVQ